jgi:hypothetical protein
MARPEKGCLAKKKLSNDSVFSQQNLQNWEGCIPHINNNLLVARGLYNNFPPSTFLFHFCGNAAISWL